MLENLFRAWPAVKDFSLAPLILTDAEIKLQHKVHDCFNAVAAGATALGANSLDLGGADKVIEFLLKNTEQQEAPFGRSLSDALNKRLAKRRLPHYCSSSTFAFQKDESEILFLR